MNWTVSNVRLRGRRTVGVAGAGAVEVRVVRDE